MSLTPAQMIIAAEMCDAREFKLSDSTSDDEMAAAAFIFDNGVFHLGPDGCDQVAAVLREKAKLLKAR